jgi:DNA-binding PadR family transcriptional regulator
MPRLTELMYFVLVGLANAGKEGLHGYGILKMIEQLTEGTRQYALPSLYEALRTLQGYGLVGLAHEEIESGRLRKYFRITGAGQAALHEEHSKRDEIRQRVRRLLPQLRRVSA